MYDEYEKLEQKYDSDHRKLLDQSLQEDVKQWTSVLQPDRVGVEFSVARPTGRNNELGKRDEVDVFDLGYRCHSSVGKDRRREGSGWTGKCGRRSYQLNRLGHEFTWHRYGRRWRRCPDGRVDRKHVRADGIDGRGHGRHDGIDGPDNDTDDAGCDFHQHRRDAHNRYGGAHGGA